MTAREALDRLIEGNRRFVANVRGAEALTSQLRRAELAEAQRPFAIVLGCSDSRVPAELVFDQGLGALFVIRVAGNIVAPSQVGSVEFAAGQFGTRLVVVLGHNDCGAIEATLDAISGQAAPSSINVMSIVNRIRPVVEPLLQAGLHGDRAAVLDAAVRANVRASVDRLLHGSELLEKMVATSELMVVGAEYDLTTGAVDFFDVPGVWPPD